MTHFAVHQTTDELWLVSETEGKTPLVKFVNETSANHLAATLNKSRVHNPLNDLPAELRPLAELFIQLLKGHKMPLDFTTADTLTAQVPTVVKSVTDYVAGHTTSTAADQAKLEAVVAVASGAFADIAKAVAPVIPPVA